MGLGAALSVLGSAVANRSPETRPADQQQNATNVVQPHADMDRAPVVSENRRTPVVQAIEKVAPTVVTITTESAAQNPFWMFPGSEDSTGDGSGVVIDSRGIVLTNAHVVERATHITATFDDDTEYDAIILGLSPDLDLAVLQLQGASNLTAIEIGTSSDLLLGEPVIALGNPLGLGQTVTTGVVSATHRSMTIGSRVYPDFIQTDASINPGNSGGPLVNVEGRLIGINTAIRSDAQGVGFAIPSDRAIKVASDLMQFGTLTVPWLGVDLVDVDLWRLGIRGTAPQVQQLYQDSNGARSGLQVSDVILTVDELSVRGRSDLNAYLAGLDTGRRVELELIRGRNRTLVEVEPQTLPEAVVEDTLDRVLGIQVQTSRTPQGRTAVAVLNLSQDGELARMGLRPGDLIVAFNGESVDSAQAFRSAVRRAKSGHRSTATVRIQRGPSTGQVIFPI
jgi:S1-C subfamily serine protease